MSLWEKWEKEKMEKMGIKVERHDSVHVYDMRPKANIWKQAGIVFGSLVLCFAVIYITIVFITGSRWSDTYIARLLVERNNVRQRQSEQAAERQ